MGSKNKRERVALAGGKSGRDGVSLLYLPIELLKMPLFYLTTSELALAAQTSQSLRTAVATITRRRAQALGVANQVNLLHAVHIAETQKCGICRNRLIEPAAGTTKAELDEDDCTGCHIAAGACGHQFHRSCVEKHIEYNRLQGCSKCSALPCIHIECPLCRVPWSSESLSYLPMDLPWLHNTDFKYFFGTLMKKVVNGAEPDETAPKYYISHSVLVQRAVKMFRENMRRWGKNGWGYPPHPRRSPSYSYFRPHVRFIEDTIRHYVANGLFLATNPAVPGCYCYLV